MIPNQAYVNFASGELSPNVWARVDRPFYSTGCEVMRNFIPLLTGSALYRPGFVYINHTRLNRKPFYIPFEFNASQAYDLEFTDLKMRVVKDGGVVVETAKVITGITKASPGVITSVGHGFSNGDEIYIDAVVGMTELNGNFYLVANKTVNTFELTDIDGNAISTAAMTAYSSGGTAARIYEVTTPYAEADLFQLKYAQTADLMYIVHPSYAPYKLTRSGHAAWTLATYVRTADPWTGANDYPGAVGFFGGRLWMGGTNNDPDFIRGSRGPDPTTGASRYDDWTVGTAAMDGVTFTITSQNGTADRVRWFSGNSKFMVIGTFGGVYKANGGSDGAAITPTAISVSPVSSYGVADINPIFVGSTTVYVEVGNRTVRSFEFDLLADTYSAFDKNVLADEITYPGIVQIAFTQGRPDLIWAVRSDGVLLSCTFLSREDVAGWARHPVGGSGKVLSIAPDNRITGFDRLVIAVERTINGHTRRYIEYMADDPQIPDPTEYFTAETAEKTDATIFGNKVFELQKTYNRLDSSIVLDTTQNVTLTLSALTGSSVTATAGSASFAATDVGRYIFIKYLTGSETGVAKITGYTSSTIVTVQILQDFSTVNVPTGGWYLLTSTVRGLGHLEGESVGILTDGGLHPNKTVSGGLVTLDYPARYVIIGEKYLGFIRTMDLEFGALGAMAQGRPKNIQQLVFKFRNTMGGKFGTTTRSLYSVEKMAYRVSTKDYTDRPPLLFSGVKELTSLDSWEEKKNVYIIQDEPLPMNIQSVIPFMDVATS